MSVIKRLALSLLLLPALALGAPNDLSFSSNKGEGSSGLTVNVPSGAVGDALVVFAGIKNSTRTLSNYSGWTVGCSEVDSGDDMPNWYVFYKEATTTSEGAFTPSISGFSGWTLDVVRKEGDFDSAVFFGDCDASTDGYGIDDTPGTTPTTDNSHIFAFVVDDYQCPTESLPSGYTGARAAQCQTPVNFQTHLAYKAYTGTDTSPTASWHNMDGAVKHIAVAFEDAATGDTTAPALTSQGTSDLTSTTADLDVTTDEDNGTLYVVVSGSATSPSKVQVKAGQDHTGSAAIADDSVAIASSGAKSFNDVVISTGVRYAHFMHEDAAANQSTVVTTASFEIDAVAPVIDTPATSDQQAGTIDVDFNTDEGDGTAYLSVTDSATAPSAAQVKLGDDHTGADAISSASQAVSATGAQSFDNVSVSAGTRYAHVMHEDSTGNQSNVISTTSFTMAGSPGCTMSFKDSDLTNDCGDLSSLFARASVALTISSGGILSEVATNTPAFFKDEGLIFEGIEADNLAPSADLASGNYAEVTDAAMSRTTETASAAIFAGVDYYGFNEDATGDNYRIVRNYQSVTTGEEYTISTVAKKSTWDHFCMRAGAAGNDYAIFDLSDGTLDDATNFEQTRIVPLADDWYWIQATWIATDTTSRPFDYAFCDPDAAFDYWHSVTSGAELFHFLPKFELNQFATTPVNNVVTLAATTLDDVDIVDDLGQTDTTNDIAFAIEWRPPAAYDDIDVDSALFQVYNSANDNFYVIFNEGTDAFDLVKTASGSSVTVSTANTEHTFAAGESVFIVARVDSTGARMWVRSAFGQTSDEDTGATAQANFGTAPDKVNIGERDNTDPLPGGWLGGFRMYDVAPDDTTLAALTASIFDSTDTTAPILTTATATNLRDGGFADLNVTSDEAGGALYVVVTGSATQPSVAQIKAGDDHTGADAPASRSMAPSVGANQFADVSLTPGTYYAHHVQTDASSNDSNRISTGSFVIAADTSAPTLSLPSTADIQTGGFADLLVTSDELGGTMYVVVTNSATNPTDTQIKAGQDAGGATAAASASQAAVSGVNTFQDVAIPVGTAWYAHFYQEDVGENMSNIVATTSFAIAADTTAPTLSSPTTGDLQVGSADLTVTTDENGGVLYQVTTGSSTAPSKAQVKNGHDEFGVGTVNGAMVPVSGANTFQDVAIGGGNKYTHFMHEDGSGNQSTVVSTAQFTITGGSQAASFNGTAYAPGALVTASLTGWTNPPTAVAFSASSDPLTLVSATTTEATFYICSLGDMSQSGDCNNTNFGTTYTVQLSNSSESATDSLSITMPTGAPYANGTVSVAAASSPGDSMLRDEGIVKTEFSGIGTDDTWFAEWIFGAGEISDSLVWTSKNPGGEISLQFWDTTDSGWVGPDTTYIGAAPPPPPPDDPSDPPVTQVLSGGSITDHDANAETLTVEVTTSEATGTLYVVVDRACLKPTPEQVQGGEAWSGRPRIDTKASQAVTATGLQSVTLTAPSDTGIYCAYLTQEGTSGLLSEVVMTDPFNVAVISVERIRGIIDDVVRRALGN